MTFSGYYSKVSEAVFPEGEADNLINVHKLAVKDALIDLQTKVPCLRTNHAEYVGQSSTVFHCGSNVFDSVDGNVERVYTLTLAGGCDPIEYTYIDHDRMLALIKGYRCCLPSDPYGFNPYTVNLQAGPPQYVVATDATNKGYRAGAGAVYWSIHKGQIYVFPSIEDTEQIVVEWTGIQRNFSDGTVLPDTFSDRDVRNAVELYLDAEVNRRETKDMSSYQTSSKMYQEAVGQLIWECRRKQTTVRRPQAMTPDAC